MLPSLIENARSLGYRPRVHPNGFLQLNLIEAGSNRLHIWHPDLPKQTTRTAVHDHIFDMESVVKKGVLGQTEIHYSLEHGGTPTSEIYMAHYSEKSDSKLYPTGVLVKESSYHMNRVIEGDSYVQSAFTFHESVPQTDVVVTVMTKSLIYASHQPRVLVPLEETPDNSFHRENASEAFLWSIIEESV
jgi:hypothetical protein